MNDILEKLNVIDGVTGCAIFDANDQCLGHATLPVYEPILLTKVMNELREVFNLYRSIDASATLNTFIASFEEGFLIVRWVNKYAILAMATPKVNTSMLNVGLNVAALKLASATPPEVSQPAAAPPPPPIAHAPVSQQHHPSSTTGVTGLSGQSLTKSGRGLSISASSNPPVEIPPDAVGLSTINMVVKSLAKHVGPFAKILVKEELTKMGVSSQTLVWSQFDDFLTMVAKAISDQNKRRDFLNEAKALHHR